MVSKRDRIVAIADYFASLGIDVSLCNNKARGNKGFFKVRCNKYVIQIAKDQSEDDILTVMVHEFAHYVHYNHDKSLKSLEFAFDNLNDEMTEELMELTVKKVPQDFAVKLITCKTDLSEKIKSLTNELKKEYPDFRKSQPLKEIERKIKKTDAKYLLKYDRVKVLCGFSFKIYSIENSDTDFFELDKFCKMYLKLKHYQRQYKRISAKISRLNRYYCLPSEMFARFLEFYICDNDNLKLSCPQLYTIFTNKINNDELPLLKEFINMYNSCP